jgi:hypothetical protein
MHHDGSLRLIEWSSAMQKPSGEVSWSPHFVTLLVIRLSGAVSLGPLMQDNGLNHKECEHASEPLLACHPLKIPGCRTGGLLLAHFEKFHPCWTAMSAYLVMLNSIIDKLWLLPGYKNIKGTSGCDCRVLCAQCPQAAPSIAAPVLFKALRYRRR